MVYTDRKPLIENVLLHAFATKDSLIELANTFDDPSTKDSIDDLLIRINYIIGRVDQWNKN